jgi:hypothetical protein
MHAGVSAIDITPPPGLPLQGHWSSRVSRQVLHPLELRAIVLQNDEHSVCLITLDVIGVTLETTNRIRTQIHGQTGIPPDRVMVACSHTHCAPAVLPCLGLTPDPQFMQRLESAAVNAAVAAAKELESVTLGMGCGAAHFNVNRRPLPDTTEMAPNHGGLVDRRVRVLRIDRRNGKPLAVLFHYSCHPTTLSGRDGLISPDYPGVARERIERELACRAMFLPGCCGNVRPLILDECNAFTSATPEQLDGCGRQLADTVIATARSLRTSPTSRLQAAQVPVRLPFQAVAARAVLGAVAGGQSPMDRALMAPWARRMLSLMDAGTLPAEETSVMQAMRIGPMLLIGIPGEPVQEIGHAIEKAIREITAVAEIIPVGYSNDMVGYLCTPQHHAEGGYEPAAYPYFNRPAAFVGEQDVVVDRAVGLCRQLQCEPGIVGE